MYEPEQHVVFHERRAAGNTLAQEMLRRAIGADVVVGLARGGVPVGYEVADALGVPLDVLVVKKLRSPMSDELAIGAVCADGTSITMPDVVAELRVPQEYLATEMRVRLLEAQEAEQRLRRHRPKLDVTGATVIVVDDGIATGATMEAAVRSLRAQGAARIVVAAPVGARAACAALRRVADDVVCLFTPAEFWAVGQFYTHFPPVPDDEVQRLLDAARGQPPAAGATA